MVRVAVARGNGVDKAEPRRVDDATGHAHVRGGRLRVLLGQRVGEVGIEQNVPAFAGDQEAALAEPPEVKRPGSRALHICEERVVGEKGLDQRPSSSRAIRTPATRFASLERATQRAVWLRPQSGANDSRSGGARRRKCRTRAATSSGGSIQELLTSTIPTATSFCSAISPTMSLSASSRLAISRWISSTSSARKAGNIGAYRRGPAAR